MKIIVFGANGKVGTHVVDLLVKNGHQVIAVVHGNNSFESFSNLEVVRGDIYDRNSFENSIKGCDVVVSTLGSWGAPKKDVVSTGIKNIMLPMNKHGVRRIITLTGADARASGDNLGLLHRINRLLLMSFAKHIVQDGEDHLRLLQSSKLDWTTLRSPVMRNTEARGFSINQNRPKPWEFVSRQDVASAIVSLAEDNSNCIKSAPYIHSK